MIDPHLARHLQRAQRPVLTIDRLRFYLGGPGNLLWTLALILLAAAHALGLSNAWVDYVRLPFGRTAEVIGTVLDSGDTNTEINERTVSWVSFSFPVEDRLMTTLAYGSQYYPAEGSRVRVEYLVDDPARARIVGRTRHSMLGPVVLFFLAATMVVTVLALWRSLTTRRWLGLLEHGRPGRARLVEQRATSIEVNDEPLVELHFEYQGEDGQTRRWRTRRTRHHAITDDEEELVLYAPGDPGSVVFMDELPLAMAPGPRGEWQFVGHHNLLRAVLWRASLPLLLGLVGLLT